MTALQVAPHPNGSIDAREQAIRDAVEALDRLLSAQHEAVLALARAADAFVIGADSYEQLRRTPAGDVLDRHHGATLTLLKDLDHLRDFVEGGDSVFEFSYIRSHGIPDIETGWKAWLAAEKPTGIETA